MILAIKESGVKLIIIRGASGSGKSTLARQLVEQLGYSHYEADMYFMVDGKYRFDASLLKQAHAWCQQSTKDDLDEGKGVIVSNTFTRPWEMEFYRNLDNHYIITLYDDYGNVHNVPEAVVERMKVDINSHHIENGYYERIPTTE